MGQEAAEAGTSSLGRFFSAGGVGALLQRPLAAGLKGTYQGLTATVLKQGSNQAIRFFVMTSLKNWYKGTVSLSPQPTLGCWLLQSIFGSWAWAFHQHPLHFSWLSQTWSLPWAP